MIATLRSAALVGVGAHPIDIEVEFAKGLPVFTLIGLPNAAVKESRYRVQCALRAFDFELPKKKVTLNLAPAALPKQGAAFDLPIAIGVLIGAGIVPPDLFQDTLFIGELSLAGQLRPVRGALAAAALAKNLGLEQIVVPPANGPEAAAVEGVTVFAPRDLGGLLAHFLGRALLPVVQPRSDPPAPFPIDLAEIRGQPMARRALEIAAAGAHNVLMTGPPGSGKTMLARRLPTILPAMTLAEKIEVTKIWSAAGLTIGARGIIEARPFRAPHASISEAGLVGGSVPIRPGEVSLAHKGVLFLDEIAELPRRVLESLRQPMEDRRVTISRARQSVRMPCDFMLVGAANPCPCGWFQDASERCSCTDSEIHRYTSRISGPLIDRMDLIVDVPSLSAQEILEQAHGERSELVRGRVSNARARAHARGVTANGALTGRRLRAAAGMDRGARKLLAQAVDRLRLSARVIDRTIRVARTIADLEEKDTVGEDAVAEALQYRPPAGWQAAPPVGAIAR